MASVRGSSGITAFPKSLTLIAVSAGGLALFLFFASWGLVSYPISSTVRGYFYSVETSNKIEIPISLTNQSAIDSHLDNNAETNDNNSPSFSNSEVLSKSYLQVPTSSTKRDENFGQSSPLPSLSPGSPKPDLHIPVSSSTETDDKLYQATSPHSTSYPAPLKSDLQIPVSSSVETNDKALPKSNLQAPGSSIKTDGKVDQPSALPPSSLGSPRSDFQVPFNFSMKTNEEMDQLSHPPSLFSSGLAQKEVTFNSKPSAVPGVSPLPNNGTKETSVDSGCDLYHGNWFYDASGPSYTNKSCPVLTQMQNCQGNGRPDKEYENWRWKPFQCDLPKFDAKKFLELMRGKTVAFIGDSVARNQMESMLCLLWQVEVPKNRGNRRMQRYYFRSTSTMIVRIWSSWLVHKTSEALDFAPEGVVKLHLDAPDWDFMEFIPTFNVIVLSSGHWFAKQSVYVLNNEIVGGQLWWPKDSPPMKVNNIDAFGISVETIITALATHPNYTGLTILRSFSPDHYEGGAWNTGGSCTGKSKPLAAGELVDNGFTNIMHEKQVKGFNQGAKKATSKSKLHLMDITEAFAYRHDGHPGPYRSPDPNKITQRGPDGKPPPQDCLHWCMPGAVDTWNELVAEIIRREF